MKDLCDFFTHALKKLISEQDTSQKLEDLSSRLLSLDSKIDNTFNKRETQETCENFTSNENLKWAKIAAWTGLFSVGLTVLVLSGVFSREMKEGENSIANFKYTYPVNWGHPRDSRTSESYTITKFCLSNLLSSESSKPKCEESVITITAEFPIGDQVQKPSDGIKEVESEEKAKGFKCEKAFSSGETWLIQSRNTLFMRCKNPDKKRESLIYIASYNEVLYTARYTYDNNLLTSPGWSLPLIPFDTIIDREKDFSRFIKSTKLIDSNKKK